MSSCQDVSVEDDELITQWGLLVEGFNRASKRLHDEMADSGCPGLTWFEVLLRLDRTPGHRLPMTQLAHEVEMTSGGFTKVADKLEEAGLASRVGCPSDRRVTWMELTELGVKTAHESKTFHAAALRRLVDEHIGLEDLATLGKIMRKLRDGLDAGPAGKRT
jgi:DNA-binding MarR family transcriptional regulator